MKNQVEEMEQSGRLKLDLQLFAEEGAGAGDAPPADGGAGEGAAEKTYTEADLSNLKTEWEKEYQAKLEAAKATGKQEGISEAERLAKLTEAERLQEQLAAAQRERDELKNAAAKASLEQEAIRTLASEKLPASFAPFVMAGDAAGISNNIKALKETYQAAVQAEVEERLKGKPPKGGSGSTTAEDMAAQIKKQIEGSR